MATAMTRRVIVGFAMALAVVTAGGCAVQHAPAAAPRPQVEAEFRGLLEHTLDSSGHPPGVMLRVDSPRLDLHWAGAVGVSSLASARPLDVAQPFRIASNTKTFVAAAVLRLVEMHRFALDDPLERVLSADSLAALRDGGYAPAQITVRMLLQHTGGVFDFASCDEYMRRVREDPAHRWTRAEQLQLAMRAGRPVAAPDERFSYSDTGYILLAEAVERASHQPLPAALRTLLGTSRLGLSTTWFESLEPVPPSAGQRVEQYMDGAPGSVVDASADLYGGGGLVSTLDDLGRWIRDIVRGRPFKDPATAVLMKTPSSQSLATGTAHYGMAIAQWESAGLTCYGHNGFWGTSAWHCPALDLTIVAVVTNTTARPALAELTKGAAAVVVGMSRRE